MFHQRLHALAIASIVSASCLPIAAVTESDMERANKLFAARKYAQAILEYKKVLDVDPGHWAANYQVTLSWMAQFHPQSTTPEDVEIRRQAAASFEKLMTLSAPRPED